jgi:exonuclease SbcC
MRPRELTLRGFRSYADDSTFGFADRSLVGIVGPIGSGKSSILDAVSFALYGKTPRIERDTKSLINQRRDSLHVSLTFEVDGTVWKAVRVVRRSGAAAHTLYRVEGDQDVEVADRAREMGEKVEEILGLDFEAFRRSVLLAQNQFAGFLEASGTDRGKVLKGVFGFDRLDAMRDAVKIRLDGLGGRLQVLADRRETAESDRKDLAEKQHALVAADERARTLEALRGSVSQVEEVLRTAEQKATTAAGRIKGLEDLVASIPDRDSTEDLFRSAVEADAAVMESTAAVEAAEVAVASAVGAVEAAVERAGGREALEGAAGQVARHGAAVAALESESKRLAAAQGTVESAESALDGAGKGLADAEKVAQVAASAAEKADVDEIAARDALHAAHAADRAHSLRAELVAGEPCPVCDQVVTALPRARPAAKVDAAEKKAQKAAANAAKAGDARSAAHAAVAQKGAALEAAAERLDQAKSSLVGAQESEAKARAAVEELATAIAGLLGEGDPEERLAVHRAAVAAAEKALAEARSRESAVRREADAARTGREAVRAAVERLRTNLSRLAGRLDADIEVGESPAEVEDGMRALRTHWLEARESAGKEQEQAQHEVEAAREARAELLEGAGLADKDDIVEVSTEAAREATALGAAVEILEKRLAEMEALADEEREIIDRAARLERLHTDLRPSGFLEFVLDERRRELADLASEHLETLTAQRYRFSNDGEFNVVDLAAADAVRAPSSLSGGETFLASLALALALAEIVSREGGRLDAFFLDEGFGSLDPEHLDLAMRGIERLVSAETDRLVVLVSHVPAMREWIEDLIVLDRDPVTGSTRLLDGAVR